ncbi:hypothetical protein LBMAG52_08410 [Planctomycetia bacterium]|nr:hypothetical protein LBMAG52_08410 [Planctomycetia bacterium]
MQYPTTARGSRTQRRLLALIGLSIAVLIVWTREQADSQESPRFDAASVEFFQTKVKPLLESRCFECHGPEAKKLKGGLSLASRADVLRGGDSGAAIVLGKPAESLLVKAINYVDFEMPPKSRLPEGEVAILTEWVKRGAPWSASKNDPARDLKPEAFPLAERKAKHWAWKPVAHVEPPKVRQPFQADPNVNSATFRDSDAVDQFILAKLEEHGLSHAAAADRRTLLRRVYFTLIGLPPTPAEADEFVADKAPTREALARVVDRLLDSPHFGERWARHWLDLVRYAETLGHEFDYPLHHAHQYRDYVIRALNADVPYDRFVVEHIAGDLLASRESRVESREQDKNVAVPSRLHPADGYNESILATGFWFLGEDKHAPVDAKGEQAARIDNQLDVFTKTFLGLTVACARCHDHKFDAISTHDYYALCGFLQSSRRQAAYLDPGGKIDAAVASLGQFSPAMQKQLLADERRKQEERQPSSVEKNREAVKLLLAAREVLNGTPTPADEEHLNRRRQRPDEVFEDFESDRYAKWKVEGAAFAKGPAEGGYPNQNPVSGFEGKRLLNSWIGDDNLTGKLTSQPFTIAHRSITFLIGGGDHPGKTCFQLRVDGQVVRTATGRNNEKLEPSSWDISEWQGKPGTLEVIDDQKGGWGHINLDQIVFTNSSASTSYKRPPEVVARERMISFAKLRDVLRMLESDETKSPSHPLWLWRELSALPTESKQEELAARKRQLAERLNAEQQRAETAQMASPLFEDFSKATFVDQQHPGTKNSVPHGDAEHRWFTTGWSFGLDPRIGDYFRLDELLKVGPSTARSDAPDVSLLPTDGLVHSGLWPHRLRGVLRSRTFTITHPQILYRVAGKNARIRLILDGYQMMDFSGLLFSGTTFEVNTDGQWIWHRQAGDLQNHIGRRAYIELIDDGDGWLACDEIRFSNGGPEPVAIPHRNHAVVLADESVTSLESLANRLAPFVTFSKSVPAHLLAEFVQNWKRVNESVPDPMRAIAIADGNAVDENVFIRGSHKNLGPEVGRRNLDALDGIDQSIVDRESGSGRLQLALRWIDAKSNPFVPRVAVNRVWHHLFGRGIVETVDNFGVLGKEPTHPELLDHLAETFVADGWSLKRLIRRIVLTNTWQMASGSKSVPRPSDSGPNADEIDPQNLWLPRAPIHRLEGEAIRDSMLLIAGRLNRQTLGPSVPVHLTPFMQGRGRPGNSGPLDGDGRRSIYTSINRNFLSPMMLAFDTPIPFTTIGRRNVSNVPAQALILMNDPFVLDMSKRWAERSLKEIADLQPEQRIERLYLEAFTRSPTAAEQTEALAFLLEQAKSYNLPADGWSKHVQVWTDLCHVLFNVKEFVFVK